MNRKSLIMFFFTFVILDLSAVCLSCPDVKFLVRLVNARATCVVNLFSFISKSVYKVRNEGSIILCLTLKANLISKQPLVL